MQTTGDKWLDALADAGVDMDRVEAQIVRGLLSQTPDVDTCTAIIDWAIIAQGYMYPGGYLWIEFIQLADGSRREKYWYGNRPPTQS